MFNLHAQFERMRDDGRYQRMRDTIRRRDTDLQGYLNPMVSDHGETSEARQYAGRAVPADWTPPFEPRDPDAVSGGGGAVNPARTRFPRPGEPPAYGGTADGTRRRLDPHRPRRAASPSSWPPATG